MITNLVKETLEKGQFGSFQTAALVLFVLMMLAITIWIYLPGSKAYYDKIAAEGMKGDSRD